MNHKQKSITKQSYQKLIIRGGKLIVPGLKTIANPDLYLESGIIKKIGCIAVKDAQQINLIDTDYISPGFIDLHCHLREPGFIKSETIQSGSLSAIAGGFTYICCMPNTEPAIDNPKVVKYIQDQAEQANNAKVLVIGAVSKNRQGKRLVDLEKMVAAGIVAISDDGSPISNSEIMRDALLLCKKFNIPVINHCEILALSKNGVINQGKVSKKLGLKGIPDTAESIMVLRDILLAEQTNGWVHIAHVSCKKSVDLIRWAKKRDVKITAETCPHYFTLTDQGCLNLNTNYKVSPPLRTKADVQAIKQGLADGTIDAIATDHAPWENSYKQKSWEKAKSGMIGFETAFSLGYQELVLKKYLSLEKYLACLVTNPAQIIHQSSEIKVGNKVSLTIFNLTENWTLRPTDIISKSKNSPFIGKRLIGKIKKVILNNTIFEIN